MGCGVDFSADSSSGYVNLFFTKNGKQVRWEGEEERQERTGRGEMMRKRRWEEVGKGRWDS